MKKNILFIFLTFILITNLFSEPFRFQHNYFGDEYYKYLVYGDYATEKLDLYPGDKVAFDKYHFIIADVSKKNDGSFVYLLAPIGHQSFSKCFYLVSQKQIGTINLKGEETIYEDFYGEYIGDEEYKRGYKYIPCECFRAIYSMWKFSN